MYDITPHLKNHPGWDGAGVSTVLAIMNVLGRECSEEFDEILSHHTAKVRAELKVYRIGRLVESGAAEGTPVEGMGVGMGMAAEGMAAEGGKVEGREASDCAATVPFVSHRIYDLPDNPPVKDRTVKSSMVHVFTVEPALAALLNQGAAAVAMPTPMPTPIPTPTPTPMPSPYHPTTSPPHFLNAPRVVLAGAADGAT